VLEMALSSWSLKEASYQSYAHSGLIRFRVKTQGLFWCVGKVLRSGQLGKQGWRNRAGCFRFWWVDTFLNLCR